MSGPQIAAAPPSDQRVQSLWAGAVPDGAHPGTSLKSGNLRATTSATSRLVIRARQVGETARPETIPDSDFELGEILGQGGMGIVYSGRQASLDRRVAIKVIQPAVAHDPDMINEFVAEAMVTGELDHPNIVPIHDLGGREDGTLFYAMKEVKGTSWDKVIGQKREEENLHILLSVCDAVAFAHDKGVIHRDIKPENVMLGDYGEVYLMDWGLAASVGCDKAERLMPQSGRAGTPAYMAPEMARCEWDRIGRASDIYLLGATLYEIVTGLKPHGGETVFASLREAMENTIQPTQKTGELLEIARRAMATEPATRFASVKDLQQAIRTCQSHAASLNLAAEADQALATLPSSSNADLYSQLAAVSARSLEALDLWEANPLALRTLHMTRLRLAEEALGRLDLNLAQSELGALDGERRRFGTDYGPPAPAELVRRINAAARKARRRRLLARLSRVAAVGGGACLLAASAIAYRTAEPARRRAVAALARANAESYMCAISLAQIRLNEGANSQARTLLDSTVPSLRSWEWGWLANACSAAQDSEGHAGTVGALAFSRDGSRILTGAEDCTARLWDTQTGRQMLVLKGHRRRIHAVGFTADDSRLLASSGAGENMTKVWDARTGDELLTFRGYPGSRVVPAFTSDGRWTLAETSPGRIQVWNTQNGDPEVTLVEPHGHAFSWARFSPDGRRMQAVSTNDAYAIWRLDEPGTTPLTGTNRYLPWAPGYMSPHGDLMIIPLSGLSNSAGTSLPVVETGTGREVLRITNSGGRAHASFSDDERFITLFAETRAGTGEWQRTYWLLDASTGRPLLTIPDNGFLRHIWPTPDGRMVVCARAMTGERLGPTSYRSIDWMDTWDVQSGRLTSTIQLPSYWSLSSVVFSPKGRVAACGISTGALVWDLITGREVVALKGRPRQEETCLLDSKTEAPAGEGGWVVRQKEFAPGKAYNRYRFTCAAISVEGDRLVAGCLFHHAMAWVAPTYPELTLSNSVAVGHDHCVAFSPDGRRILTARGPSKFDTRDDTKMEWIIQVWDADTGIETLRMPPLTSPVSCVGFTADGSRIVAALGSTASRKGVSYPTSIDIFDSQRGARVDGLTNMPSGLECATLSPGGTRVLMGWRDGTAAVWDLQDKRQTASVVGEGQVTAVAFSRDESAFAVARIPNQRMASTRMSDGRISLIPVRRPDTPGWTVNLSLLRTHERSSVLSGIGTYVRSLAFSADGRRLATAHYNDNDIRFFDLNTGRLMLVLEGHPQAVEMLAFSRDGMKLMSVDDENLRVWEAANWR